jgi:hypothetical protein
MMQKSTTFTTIFRVKKCYFHYDFACKKVTFITIFKKYYIELNITFSLLFLNHQVRTRLNPNCFDGIYGSVFRKISEFLLSYKKYTHSVYIKP